MIDAQLRQFVDPPADRLASWFVARGINADQVTLVGFFVGMLAVLALWLGWPLLALVLVLVNRVADGVDGAIARRTETTDRTLAATPAARELQSLTATLAANDPLLDAMAVTRGRFAVETPGLSTLYLPPWAEVSRVIEDCR